MDYCYCYVNTWIVLEGYNTGSRETLLVLQASLGPWMCRVGSIALRIMISLRAQARWQKKNNDFLQ